VCSSDLPPRGGHPAQCNIPLTYVFETVLVSIVLVKDSREYPGGPKEL